MPGKVNPVVPDVANRSPSSSSVEISRLARLRSGTAAAEPHGAGDGLQHPALTVLRTNAVDVRRAKCVADISANAETSRRYSKQHRRGNSSDARDRYDPMVELAKLVLSSRKTIRKVLAEQPDLSEDLIARAADPHHLTHPTRSRLHNSGRRLVS
nr:hypothetical protein [Mesorhizobium sp. WSM3879]